MARVPRPSLPRPTWPTLVSLRWFLLAFAVALPTTLAVRQVVAGGLVVLVGAFVAGGVVGIVEERRRYLEVAAASVCLVVATLLLGELAVRAGVQTGASATVAGVGGSVLCGTLGHHLGRGVRRRLATPN